MGDDTPLAVLSLRPRLLYTYFKQLFAQVTNPPIDPIREKLVMSLHTVLGWRRNLLSETPEHCRQIILESPILLDAEVEQLAAIGGEFPAITIPASGQFRGDGGLVQFIEFAARSRMLSMKAFA